MQTLVQGLTFICLISIAVFSMLIGEDVENRIVDLYFPNWLFATFLYRVFILIVLFLGFLALIGVKNNFFKLITSIFIVFIILDTVIAFFNSDIFESLFVMRFHQIISTIPILILPIAWFFYLKGSGQIKQVKKWVYVLFAILSIGLSFVKVVYVEDWSITPNNFQNITLAKAESLLKSNNINTIQKNVVLVFLSTECGHCRNAAKKLAISVKENILPQTVLIFPDSKKDAQHFMEINKLNGIPYFTMGLNDFIQLSGGKTPTIFKIDEKKSSQWVGAKFNNLVLWELGQD